MAIEVRIPTILRSYTGGAKSVEGAGDTLADLLDRPGRQPPGPAGRLITDEGGLHRFVNVYVNDEDVRFLGALDAKLNDGDAVTILPAVAGGALGVAGRRGSAGAVGRMARYESLLDACGGTPLVGLPRLSPSPRGPAVGQAGGPQPDRVGQGPRGAVHGARRRGGRPAPAR